MSQLYVILTSILYVSVFGLFIECWVVFRHMKNSLHRYLFLSCLAILVNNLGYALELQATSLNGYETALKFSYAGRIWLGFAFLMFTEEFCHVKIPLLVRRILPLVHVGIYITILMMGYSDLYYKNIYFSLLEVKYPVFHRENGIAHHFFIQLQIVYIAFIFIWLIMSLRKQKSKLSRMRHYNLLVAFFFQAMCYIVQIAKVFPITRLFDLTMLGSVILTIFMYFAIFKCNLLGIIDIARDFMIDRLSEGVIAVDNDGKVQYYNEPAVSLFPEIISNPQDIVGEIEYAIKNNKTITINNRIYTPEENELYGGGEILGKIYSMVDSTDLKLNEYKLKADAEVLQMAAENMKDRLLTTEELMRQDRAMRHDRRHFEALLLSLLQDGKASEAQECLKERLSQEPRISVKYCDNPTVNAAITYYVSVAEHSKIRVSVKTNIPVNTSVDEMKLAIAISNLMENAIHGCEKLPESERFIELTAKYKEQLLLEIINSCDKKVELDEEGYPYTTEAGHGVGTRSVLAFVRETDSVIKYISEDNQFKVRMIIG